MDVKPLDNKTSKTRFRHCLLPAILGMILLVQAGSAYVYHYQLDQSVSQQEIYLGNSVTMKFHVYDTQHGIGFGNAPVSVTIYRVSPPAQIKVLFLTTNASGWATTTYTPQEIAKFSFTSYSTYNYSTYPGLPPVGMQNSYGEPAPLYFNVTSPPQLHVIPRDPVGPVLLITTAAATSVPVTTPQTPQQTMPVTQVTQITQETQVTQITQVTQVPQTTRVIPSPQITYTVPASATNITPETAPPTITGIAPAGTTGMAETTPAAMPSPAGTASPLPFWPAVLIIVIILAVIGAALFLMSRKKEDRKK